MFRYVRYGLVVVALAYATLVGFLYVRQDGLIFPGGTQYQTPDEAGVPQYKEQVFHTITGQEVFSWYLPAQAGLPTIMFFHGNSGTVSRRSKRLAYYAKFGLGVLAVEYRGYGKSPGVPHEAAFIQDAETALGWLKERSVPLQSVVFVGESLGSGVATILASRHAGAALLLEAPYSSVADVAADRYWFVPVQLLLKHRFDAISVIKNVKMPLLIQHGTDDQTVPFKFGQALFDAAVEPKEFVTYEGEGHTIFNERTWSREIAFLKKHLRLELVQNQ
jgi:uncharacterized protein